MRIGHCQLDSKCGDFEGNLAKLVTGLERAEKERVEIVCYPECFLTGYPDTGETTCIRGSQRLSWMTFEHSLLVRCTMAQLFALTQDYNRRLVWDPFLREAYLLNGAFKAGIGVRAYCVARSGFAMETEYVSFNPPRTTAVKMTRGPWFNETFSGSWRFREEAEGQTRVYFRYHLRARPRWLAALVTPVIGFVFGRDTKRRLAALKRAVEESEILESSCVRV